MSFNTPTDRLADVKAASSLQDALGLLTEGEKGWMVPPGQTKKHIVNDCKEIFDLFKGLCGDANKVDTRNVLNNAIAHASGYSNSRMRDFLYGYGSQDASQQGQGIPTLIHEDEDEEDDDGGKEEEEDDDDEWEPELEGLGREFQMSGDETVVWGHQFHYLPWDGEEESKRKTVWDNIVQPKIVTKLEEAKELASRGDLDGVRRITREITAAIETKDKPLELMYEDDEETQMRFLKMSQNLNAIAPKFEPNEWTFDLDGDQENRVNGFELMSRLTGNLLTLTDTVGLRHSDALSFAVQYAERKGLRRLVGHLNVEISDLALAEEGRASPFIHFPK